MGLLDQAKAVSAPLTGEAKSIADKKTNIDQYMKAVSDPSGKPPVPAPMKPDGDKLHPNGKYGDRPGEKRIDVRDMVKPLPTYHDGVSRVPKTGPAMLEEGEAVIPKEKNPMNDWSGLVKGPKKSEKKIKHLVHRKTANGKHILEHHHTHSEDHAMEEHAFDNLADLHKHVDEHMGSPEPEASPAAAAPEAGAAPEAAAAPAM
jgi:hypothetical protein